MNSLFQLRKLRDFGERIGDTLVFIKLNWTRLLALYAVFVVPFLLTGIIFGANSMADFITGFSGSFSGMPVSLGIKMIIAAVMFLLAGASYTAVVYLYMDHFEKSNGQPPTVTDIGRKFIKPFLFNIAYSILIFTVLVIIGVIITLGMVSLKSQALLVVIVVPLLFFFGLFAMVFILMAFPVIVIVKGKFGSAIGDTFHLLKGRWWFSIGFVGILFMIYYFFSLAISTMLNLFFGLSAINMMEPEKISAMGKNYAYLFGISTLIQQVFYMVIFVGCGIHFYSMQEEKIGAGLEQQIDSLGVGKKRSEGTEETW